MQILITAYRAELNISEKWKKQSGVLFYVFYPSDVYEHVYLFMKGWHLSRKRRKRGRLLKKETAFSVLFPKYLSYKDYPLTYKTNFPIPQKK